MARTLGHNIQLDLFPAIMQEYCQASGELSNSELYQKIEEKYGGGLFGHYSFIGKKNEKVDVLKHRIRWYQQTLKHTGVIERVDRGVWRMIQQTRDSLTEIDDSYALLGFSTNLGIAVISKCQTFFSRFDQPIHLILTSPPYPLQNPRKYGNVDESQYVDWLCSTIEPVVACMSPGGSLCLNISNDIFLKSSPARSLYREKLVISLCERLGLFKLDELVWENPCKPPAPLQWASKKRVQLNVGWEPVYWFTNDPQKLRSDNRRVLQPHKTAQQKLIQSGGVNKIAINSDGAYRKNIGAYSNTTSGSIPRNVIRQVHDSHGIAALKKRCSDIGIPVHGAMMPIKLAEFLIEFTTRPGDLVADPFAGSQTTALAAERLNRLWVTTEMYKEYVQNGVERFKINR